MKSMTVNIQHIFRYSGKSLVFLWDKKPQYVILIFIDILLGSFSVFPGMYLLKYSIDMLTMKKDFKQYCFILVVIIGIILILNILDSLVKTKINLYRDVLHSQINYEIADVCMNVNYEHINEKKFLETKDFALDTLNSGKLETVVDSVAGLVSGLLVLTGTTYIISSVSPIVIIPLIISLICSIYYNFKNAKSKYFDSKLRVETLRKTNYIYEIAHNFSYAKEIRLYDLKDKLSQRLNEFQNILYKTRVKKAFNIIGFSLFMYYFADLIFEAGIYLYLGYEVLVLKTITIGNFTLIGNALRELRNRVNSLVYNLVDFTVNAEYLQAFFEFFKHKENYFLEELDKKEIENNEVGEIKFVNVSFKYPGSDFYALENVRITIPKGQKLLVVGENGAGKTTFIKLLMGLYKPTSGEILLDGVNIFDYKRSSYVKLFAAVFQDYKLFSATIKENITALNNEDSSEELLKKSVSVAKLNKKISSLDLEYNTPLYRIFDEKGVELSGGEMQNLAIARAVYKDSEFVILDEPTSALDPRAEYEIFESFQKISEGRTTVFISHRLSSSKLCDCIAVFEKGKIVEYGTHSDLIVEDGLYKELFTMQSDLYMNDEEGK